MIRKARIRTWHQCVGVHGIPSHADTWKQPGKPARRLDASKPPPVLILLRPAPARPPPPPCRDLLVQRCQAHTPGAAHSSRCVRRGPTPTRPIHLARCRPHPTLCLSRLPPTTAPPFFLPLPFQPSVPRRRRCSPRPPSCVWQHSPPCPPARRTAHRHACRARAGKPARSAGARARAPTVHARAPDADRSTEPLSNWEGGWE